jgi:hypothetical protein
LPFSPSSNPSPRSRSANVKDASEERIKQRLSQIVDLISKACVNASNDDIIAILEKLKRGEISREQAVTQVDAIKVTVTNELRKEFSDSSLTSFDANSAKTDDQIYWQAWARCSRVVYDIRCTGAKNEIALSNLIVFLEILFDSQKQVCYLQQTGLA